MNDIIKGIIIILALCLLAFLLISCRAAPLPEQIVIMATPDGQTNHDLIVQEHKPTGMMCFTYREKDVMWCTHKCNTDLRKESLECP